MNRKTEPQNDERLVIITASEIEQSVNAEKLVKFLREEGLDPECWIWRRESRRGASPFPWRERVLLSGGGQGRKALVPRYLVWMTRLFWMALLEPATTKFVCYNFDAAFPVALGCSLRPRDFLFLHSDNLSMSHRWPGALLAILRGGERLIAHHAKLHVVPGPARWPHSTSNVRIVPNSPDTAMLAEAAARADQRGWRKGDRLTVYVTGYLTKARGLEAILNAAKATSSDEVDWVMAGTPACSAAAELARLENVEFHGRIDAVDSLALYHRTHLVLTFYDPAIEINRLAEPNKWQDCIATGTPFVTNDGIATAEPFVKAGACFRVSYGEADELVGLLRSLASDLTQWHSVRGALGRFCAPPWDVMMRELLADFRRGASVPGC